MRIFLRSRLVEFYIAATLAYWVVAPFPDRVALSTMLSALTMSGGLGLMIGYSQGTWYVIRDPKASFGAKLMMLGLASCGIGLEGVFGWTLIYQYLDQPEWMRNNLVRMFFVYLFVEGIAMLVLVLFVAGKSRDSPLLPERMWGRAGVWTAAVLSATVFLIYLAGGFPAQ